MTIAPATPGVLTGVPFASANSFVFAFAEFHFGTGSTGSEHTLDSTQFAMELQLFHYDSQYDNLDDASNVWC